MSRKIIIATRGSPLALTQSKWVQNKLLQIDPSLSVVLNIVKTEGDRLQEEHHSGPLEKGLFTKEIEKELLEGRAQFAVHSCKDLPLEMPPGLKLAAIPERENPHDALIYKQGLHHRELPKDSLVMTGSPRRQLQWREIQPQTIVCDIRGNVDTRLRKLRDNDRASAIILACAGLFRLGIIPSDLHLIQFFPQQMLPAPGQGALAVQTKEDDPLAVELASLLDHPQTRLCVEAERAFLSAMGGGCKEPLGALASIVKTNILLEGVYFSAPDRSSERHQIEVPPPQAATAGHLLAKKFRASP